MFNVKLLSQKTQIPLRTIHKWAKAGKLPLAYSGGMYLFDDGAVTAAVELRARRKPRKGAKNGN